MKGSKYFLFFILFFSKNIFSQGSVVFFTGTSSSGKTTTLNIFKKFLEQQGMNHYDCLSCDFFVRDTFYESVKKHLNCDDSFEEVLIRLHNKEINKEIINEFEIKAEYNGFINFINKITELVKSDKNVLCECVLPSNKKLLERMFNLLKDVRTFFVLVYCSFEDLQIFVNERNAKASEAKTFEERCNWRDLSDVISQFCEYYKPFDVEKDNEKDVLDPFLCDDEIISIADKIDDDIKKKFLKHFFSLEEEQDSRINIELTPCLNYNFIIKNEWNNPIGEEQIKKMFKLFLISSKETFLSNEKFFIR